MTQNKQRDSFTLDPDVKAALKAYTNSSLVPKSAFVNEVLRNAPELQPFLKKKKK